MFPDRVRRRGKRRIGKRADRDPEVLGEPIGLPVHRGAACWTKMHSEFSALLPIPDVRLAGPFRSHFGSLEISTDPIRRAGSPLAFLAMAGGNDRGFPAGFHP